MSEEEKKAIERIKDIIEYGNKIMQIENEEERELEASAYFEEMPFGSLEIILNLIDKLQKKNEELKEERKILSKKLYNQSLTAIIEKELGSDYISKEKVEELKGKLQKELDKKDKVINLMAEFIGYNKPFKQPKEEIKEYFYKKVEEENE